MKIDFRVREVVFGETERQRERWVMGKEKQLKIGIFTRRFYLVNKSGHEFRRCLCIYNVTNVSSRILSTVYYSVPTRRPVQLGDGSESPLVEISKLPFIEDVVDSLNEKGWALFLGQFLGHKGVLETVVSYKQWVINEQYIK